MIWINRWPLARYRTWYRQAASSIGDQAIHSAANFLFAVLLARFLSIEEFGTFSVIYALLILPQNLMEPLIMEPLAVVGARFKAARLDCYVASVVLALATLVLLIALGIEMVALAMGSVDSPFAPAMAAAGTVSVGMPMAALLRRICYLRSNPGAALAGSLVYGPGLIGSLVALHLMDRLSVTAALYILALASLGAAAACALALKPAWVMPCRRMGVVAGLRHWRYGRWLLGVSVTFWLSTTALVPILGGLLGVQAAGAYRSLLLLFAPVARVRSALWLLVLPAVARRYHHGGGMPYLRDASARWAALFVLPSLLYSLAMVPLGEVLIPLLWPQPEFLAHAHLLPWLAAVAVLESLRHALTMPVVVSEQPQHLLWGRLTSLAVMLVVVWPLVGCFGPLGAAINAGAVEVCVTLFLLHGARSILGVSSAS